MKKETAELRGERPSRLAVSIALLIGWWGYWYTDRFALWREGIAHFVPVSAQPPTFSWLTAVLTTWCLRGVGRFAVARLSAARLAAAPAPADARS